MNAMTCTALADIAGELALDMLGGEERATALAHLETCAACRQDVALLTDAAEELLLLAPDIEPPHGFGDRVLARIESLTPELPVPTTISVRRPRKTVARRALALVAALAVVIGGVLIVAERRETHHPPTRIADMRTAGGQTVGTVALVGDPGSIVVSIPDWTGLVKSYGATIDSAYWLAVETNDGTRSLHRLPRGDGHPWHVAVGTDPRTIAAVSVVDDKGSVWCSAQIARQPGGSRE
jgi:hypothetical protein